ncbi:DEAD/DEAH box helicase [Bifidobacterium adolescentis]|uniref:DEAD/DEAH box helicase n=1 Tax=Bifidobacterium adolescentis TaxID=1680 RepID=UPI00308030F1
MANGMLADACSTLKDGEKPIIHSDRGCHYRWPEWIRICKEHGLTRSMSAKGCSPDNAAAEGFFGRLKQEFFHRRSFAGVSMDGFIDMLDDYMVWYRDKRIKTEFGHGHHGASTQTRSCGMIGGDGINDESNKTAPPPEDIACSLKKIKSLGLSKDSIYFYLGLLVKLIYSRLVDADRTDAACFETRKQYRPNTVDWQNLISRLDKSMRSFDSSSEINRIRYQINEQCCLAGARETGIYRLSIPTGGGKTLASLNFALHHALKTGKCRIIYVIPYLSITTQTAKTFRDVLGLNADSDVLLEHYSTAGTQRSADVADNASSEFEDAGEHQRKLAAERWDNPIIVTTMVEFLETVMSARGTKLRKFHNMADSVIIFDEIQSLPRDTINLFNEIVSFLSKITNSTILLCSATQPLLEKPNERICFFRKSLILLLKWKAMKTSFDVQELLLQLKIKAAMN